MTRSSSLRLVLPATSANLGPAFDAAALAIRFFLKIKADLADNFSIVANGRDASICTRMEDHLVINTYREVLESERKKVQPLALQVENQIPIGKGCGSSAAARLAGIALAVHFGCLKWNDNQIIAEASRREHHPDNAAACWLGGLTVASVTPGEDVRIAHFQPRGRWPLLVAVPQQALATEVARGVLPTHYARADVVSNVQNSMLLLSAFVQGRPELIAGALADRIHQPYRAPLCKLLEPLQSLTGRDGVLGVCLSGAGPSVLIFADPKTPVARVQKMVAAALRKQGLSAELICTSISMRGGTLSLRTRSRRDASKWGPGKP
jgi:homoserine kinase